MRDSIALRSVLLLLIGQVLIGCKSEVSTKPQLTEATPTSTPTLYKSIAVGVSTSDLYNGGQPFSCGISTAGALTCWGQNISGQLGDGTYYRKNSPTLI